jgi:hypothetical protein
MCVCAIDSFLHAELMANVSEWADRQAGGDETPFSDWPLTLIIIDEPEKGDKGRIQSSFRSIRAPLQKAWRRIDEDVSREASDDPRSDGVSSFISTNRLRMPVDDVFFGNSANSIGLQIADVCNWVMWRHLSGDPAANFYERLMEGTVICAKPEPEWTQYRHLFRSHD